MRRGRRCGRALGARRLGARLWRGARGRDLWCAVVSGELLYEIGGWEREGRSGGDLDGTQLQREFDLAVDAGSCWGSKGHCAHTQCAMHNLQHGKRLCPFGKFADAAVDVSVSN